MSKEIKNMNGKEDRKGKWGREQERNRRNRRGDKKRMVQKKGNNERKRMVIIAEETIGRCSGRWRTGVEREERKGWCRRRKV